MKMTIFYLAAIIGILFIFSCKSTIYDHQRINNCGVKPIVMNKFEKDKKHNLDSIYIQFMNGFENTNIEIVRNKKTIIFNQKISTDFSTSIAKTFQIRYQDKDLITVQIEKNECIQFTLDPYSVIYEIHQDEKRFYLNRLSNFNSSE